MRKRLAAGLTLPLTCNLRSKAIAKLSLKRKLARKLGLKGTRVGGGSGSCATADGGSLKLRLTKRAARKLRGRKMPGTLTSSFKQTGASKVFKLSRPVKIV